MIEIADPMSLGCTSQVVASVARMAAIARGLDDGSANQVASQVREAFEAWVTELSRPRTDGGDPIEF